MTEKEYRSSEGISRSALWRIHESPEKFKWEQEHPAPKTPALTFGAIAHKLLLEPDRFFDEYAVCPDIDRRSKDGKNQYNEFVASLLEGVEVVSDSDFRTASDMVEVARKTPFVERLLQGEHEQSFYWVDDLTGELCKCRLDCVGSVNGKPLIVEYKTTLDASNEAFMRSAINNGYDFQAAFEINAIKYGSNLCKLQDDDGNWKTVEPTFVIIAQEKKPPYSVNIMSADAIFIERGQNLFRELLGIYHDCKTTGNWYGYLGKFESVNNISLPAWLAKELDN